MQLQNVDKRDCQSLLRSLASIVNSYSTLFVAKEEKKPRYSEHSTTIQNPNQYIPSTIKTQMNLVLVLSLGRLSILALVYFLGQNRLKATINGRCQSTQSVYLVLGLYNFDDSFKLMELLQIAIVCYGIYYYTIPSRLELNCD